MYTASQQLVDILLKNGFRNKSHLYVPDYGEKFKFIEPYNPQAYKREYGLGYGKRRLGFYLDYINMAVTEGGGYITDSYLELDECKLRSIIAYFHCSYARQQTLKQYCNHKIEFAGEIMQGQRKMGLSDAPFDDTFEILFKQILI